MKRDHCKVIILGATWGTFEATVGYLLHLSGLRIGSLIWFPIAYFFVHKIYRDTNSFSSAMVTALIAAVIKLVNLLFPGRIDLVINPAMSIILEALAIVLVYNYVLDKQIDKVNPLTVLLTGFIWRSFYIGYILALPQANFGGTAFTTITSFLEFMFPNNIMSVIVILAGLYTAKLLNSRFTSVFTRLRQLIGQYILKPKFALCSMILAIMTQIFVR